MEATGLQYIQKMRAPYRDWAAIARDGGMVSEIRPSQHGYLLKLNNGMAIQIPGSGATRGNSAANAKQHWKRAGVPIDGTIEKLPRANHVSPSVPGLPTELREARVAAGLTLKDLAPLIGTSFTTISEWELGKRPIPEHRMQRIRDLFGKDFGTSATPLESRSQETDDQPAEAPEEAAERPDPELPREQFFAALDEIRELYVRAYDDGRNAGAAEWTAEREGLVNELATLRSWRRRMITAIQEDEKHES